MTRQKTPVAFLLAIAALLFFVNLGGYDLWPADEPRFGEVAREMLHSGDYLVPRVNGEPYNEKPPLLFWLIAAVSQPFGDVSAWTARTPSAVAGLLTVLLTYLLARRLFDARTAFWSGAVLMTTSFFWWEARTAQIDMLLTACLTMSLYAFWRWLESHRNAWLVLFWGAVAAALYAKGPPGLVFPLLLIFAYFWKQPEERRKTHWIFGTLAAIALIAAWLIPARMAISAQAGPAETEIAGNLLRQTIGRMFGTSKPQWPWYYLINLPVNLLPWALFLPWTLPWIWKRRHDGPAMRLLWCWTVPAFVFFSICIGKRSVYLLPLQPALAILIAASVLDLMDDAHRAPWRKRTAAVFGILLLILGAAPFAVPYTPYAHIWSRELAVFGLFTMALALGVLFRALRTPAADLHILAATRIAAIMVLCAMFLFPIVNLFKSARYVCAPVRALSHAGTDYRLYSVAFSREEFIFYAEHFHTPVLTDVLDVELPDDVSMEEAVKSQRRLRKALAEAVETVPVADMARLSDDEVQALRTAAAQAAQEVESRDHIARLFEDALVRDIDAFASEFEQTTPAFLFVQTADWRWLVALAPRLQTYNVILERPVGRRDLLLIANPAGAELTTHND